MGTVHCIDNTAHAFNLQTRARSCSTALHVADDVAGRRPVPVQDGEIANVEVTRVTVATRPIVARALCDGEDTAGIVQLEVLKRHVGSVAVAAPATIRRVS